MVQQQFNLQQSSSLMILLFIILILFNIQSIYCITIKSHIHQYHHQHQQELNNGDLNFPIYPFTRSLTLNDTGSDVYKLQLLLYRFNTCEKLYPNQQDSFLSALFDIRTMNCLIHFINEFNLNLNNNINNKSPYISLTPNVANELINKYMDYDGYIDSYVYPNGTMYKPIPSQYKYYIYVPVYRNRSIETICYLFDKYGNKKHSFKCRTHGQPNLNQLTSDGDTPTGLYTFDLNTPEDNPKEYGPYDVNRAVYGLKGNGLLIYPKYRSGILLHTGEWNIKPNDPMPNSHGCIHAHPQDIELIANILKNQLNVIANENTFGKYPYPYTQQGLLSVVLIK